MGGAVAQQGQGLGAFAGERFQPAVAGQWNIYILGMTVHFDAQQFFLFKHLLCRGSRWTGNHGAVGEGDTNVGHRLSLGFIATLKEYTIS